MVSKKILGSGIAVTVVLSAIIGIAVYNNYLNFQDDSGSRTIIDSLGREVTIADAKDIDKIVGINPGTLRLLIYMDAKNLVCGVEDIEINMNYGRAYLYAYPELSDLPSIGPKFGGDPELITGQNPDVIFATLLTVESADKLQEQTGIPLIVINYGDDFGDLKMSSLYDSLEILGDVLGKQDRAEELINYLNNLINDLDDRTKDISDGNKDWTYVGGIGKKGVHGLGSTDCSYEPLAFINQWNSAGGLGEGYQSLDSEGVLDLQENPGLDYLIIDGGGYSQCIQDINGTAYDSLNCLQGEKKDAVMTLAFNFYNPNIANIFLNAYYLGKRFFANEFDDLNYTDGKIYDDIYNEILGEPVYDDVANYYYGGFHNITQAEINNFCS